MPLPPYFKRVATRVFERYGTSLSPSELADRCAEELDIAEELMGVLASPAAAAEPARASKPLVISAPSRPDRTIDMSKGLLIDLGASAQAIDEEAPPAAVVRNPDGAVIPETNEEVELKKSHLHNWILTNLPSSITVNLPGIGNVLLIRYAKPSPAGMNFIRVLYAQYAEQEDGPQFQLSAADQHLDQDVDRLKNEIIKQAEMRYRKERPKIVPRTTPPPPMPDVDKMFLRTPENSTDDVTSPEEISDWNKFSR